MNEVFTINGAVTELPSNDQICAQRVRTPFVLGAVMTVGTVPTALYGVYKLARKRPAAGFVSLLAAGLLGVFGQQLVARAVQSFATCRRG